MRVIGQRIKRMATIAVTAILSVYGLVRAGHGRQPYGDQRMELGTEHGEVIRRFEKANPDIRVKWTNISGRQS